MPLPLALVSAFEPRPSVPQVANTLIGAAPDRFENYKVHKDGPRQATRELNGEYYANEKDAPGGILINGTLPTSDAVGVHSLTDVAVYAWGPCQEIFGGTYSNIDIFYKMAECLGLSDKGNGGCKSKRHEQ